MPDQFFPYGGVRRDDGLNAADAARILRQHFGFASESPDSGYGDPTGSLALGRLRDTELSELNDRIPNEEGASVIPMEGFVPGEPGRRYTSALPLSNLITDRSRRRQLEGEIGADPFTGDAAQARTQQVQDALDSAATTMRPEIADQARTLAERNAFAKYMQAHGLSLGEKMGEYEAAGSPAARDAALMPIRVKLSGEAQDLANADLERQGRAKMQPQLVPGQRVDANGRILDAPVKSAPNTQEEAQLRSIDNTWQVVTDLKSLLDPSKNQVTNSLANHAMFALYKAGIDPTLFGADAKTRQRFQLASLVQVLGTTPYANQTRNYNFIQDIRQHLTDPTATDQFLYGQITELEKRLPQFRDTVERVHKYPFLRPEGMPGGDEDAAPNDADDIGGGGRIRIQGMETPGGAPIGVPARHPKYAPPTPDELAEYYRQR